MHSGVGRNQNAARKRVFGPVAGLPEVERADRQGARVHGFFAGARGPAPGLGRTHVIPASVGSAQRFFSSASSSISKYVLYAFMRLAKPNMGMRSKALQLVVL
jgi:hypothetical protein